MTSPLERADGHRARRSSPSDRVDYIFDVASWTSATATGDPCSTDARERLSGQCDIHPYVVITAPTTSCRNRRSSTRPGRAIPTWTSTRTGWCPTTNCWQDRPFRRRRVRRRRHAVRAARQWRLGIRGRRCVHMCTTVGTDSPWRDRPTPAINRADDTPQRSPSTVRRARAAGIAVDGSAAWHRESLEHQAFVSVRATDGAGRRRRDRRIHAHSPLRPSDDIDAYVRSRMPFPLIERQEPSRPADVVARPRCHWWSDRPG